MKQPPPNPSSSKPNPSSSKGFALIVTISLMVLLTLLAVGMLGLASITLRSSSLSAATSEAQANARMALALALGELQAEMGPDMRISVESAMFDSDVDSPGIDGLAQSRWMASYDSWGNWLNAPYARPGGGGQMGIADTYGARREPMFRRWLVTLPEGTEMNVQAPDSLDGWSEDNSVILVGEGSLGTGATTNPDQVTRGYLVPVAERGRHAWWIGPENHRAKVDIGGEPRSLTPDVWELTHGDTAEVAVGQLPGMAALDTNPAKRSRMVSLPTLRLGGVSEAAAEAGFFDLSANSQGVLASVRTGQLKRDLSLLFELDNDKLPERYRWVPSSIREPSVRPMSPDLLAYGPRIPNRHFASWTNMRHFYRMYRQASDATAGLGTASGNPASGALQWDGSRPWTTFVATAGVGSNKTPWDGANSYWRYPCLAKITFIYSLRTTKVDPAAPDNDPSTQYRCSVIYTPVFVFWNPYNVELRVPDNQFHMMNNAYRVLPFRGEVYANNQKTTTVINGASMYFSNLRSVLRSEDGGDIVFRPGELRVFSHRTFVSGFDNNALYPGFDPQAIGGEERLVSTYTRGQNPSVALAFSESVQHGNHQWGNTPGSLCHTPDWNGGRIPLMYQNDWFQVAQTRTPITPDPEPTGGNIASRPEHLAPWDFSNQLPLPVAYAQLSIKGLSPIDYESIDWAEDWRSRNWLHNPPYYGGNALYISENSAIAHTQRIDNPYQMHFGPASMAEMPRIISHVGSSAFLGSGSSPYERVNAVSVQELPTAPIGSLAGFAGMRINPGWADYTQLNPSLRYHVQGPIGTSTGNSSFFAAEVKATAYQSGVAGVGPGNSFAHPMLPRAEVYRFFNNSVSADPVNRQQPFTNINYNDNKVFNDFWDHGFLLNDALWDDYFVSSLADQSRPGALDSLSREQNVDRMISGGGIPNSRFVLQPHGQTTAAIRAEMKALDAYLKLAGNLMVDGMFNVNSTSVPAWYSLFAGIRERKLVHRDQNGSPQTIEVPAGKKIALGRFNTEVSDQEMDDPAFGVPLDGGLQGWSGVRFLNDDQLWRLAEECVRQVKLRGPFLNYAEFINRRLSNDQLGLMGALQSAIDYDDASLDPDSINYRFKNGPDFMMDSTYLGSHQFSTPEAMHGSRFAGIPGYVIQSDLLKPIANTLAVRDDTFRVRAYGESLDSDGKVIARAWCEVIVQRIPQYLDPVNKSHEPLRELGADGSFTDNPAITEVNRRFGRKLKIVDFRWLSPNEI